MSSKPIFYQYWNVTKSKNVLKIKIKSKSKTLEIGPDHLGIVCQANYIIITIVSRVVRPGIFKQAQKFKGYVYAVVLISEFNCIISLASARRHTTSHVLKAYQWKFEAMEDVTCSILLWGFCMSSSHASNKVLCWGMFTASSPVAVIQFSLLPDKWLLLY